MFAVVAERAVFKIVRLNAEMTELNRVTAPRRARVVTIGGPNRIADESVIAGVTIAEVAAEKICSAFA